MAHLLFILDEVRDVNRRRTISRLIAVLTVVTAFINSAFPE